MISGSFISLFRSFGKPPGHHRDQPRESGGCRAGPWRCGASDDSGLADHFLIPEISEYFLIPEGWPWLADDKIFWSNFEVAHAIVGGLFLTRVLPDI